jgi:(R,R)-butanediol dehydrogenase/meso-butanediol dehydrogenase/diacetyl reductase
VNIPKNQRGFVLTKNGLIYRDDLPVPQNIPTGYLLLKILGCSICGTDFGMMKAEKDPWTRENVFPKMSKGHDHILGHEFFGKVVKKGLNTEIEIGRVGACESHYPSPECIENGIYGHTCKDYGIFGVWGSRKRDGTYAPLLGGAFSEYIMVPELNLYDLGNLYKKFHCSLIEPLGNTWMIIEDLLKRGFPEDMLIFGSGPHGLNLQIFAKYHGVKNIVVVEPNDYRRGFARGIGAGKVFLKPNELTKKVVNEITNGKGFDVVNDMVGLKIVVDTVLENDFLKENGILGLFGLPKEANRKIYTNLGEKSMSDFIFKRQTKKGKTKSGRDFYYKGYSGRTDSAIRNLIKALKDKEKGDFLINMLEKPLRIAGPLNKLKEMLDNGFPDNKNHDDLKIGFTAFV